MTHVLYVIFRLDEGLFNMLNELTFNDAFSLEDVT
jgi:hypothetical protein